MTGFFASDDWAEVLGAAFDARMVPAGDGWAWTVFRRFGLRVAYPRFPIGLNGVAPIALGTSGLSAIAGRADLLRIDVAPPEGARHRHVLVQPRSWILDLAGWSVEGLGRSVRARIRKAERVLVVRPATSADGATLAMLYRATITRKGGTARYGERYFEALCRLSEAGRGVDVGIAEHEGRIAGFIAIAREEDATYYLHAGYDGAHGGLRPGYCLMAWAIERARDAGSGVFDMLTSPPHQPSLRAFKEQFGARSTEQSHHEVALTRVGDLIRWAAHMQRQLAG